MMTGNNNSPSTGLGIYRQLRPPRLGQPLVGRKVIFEAHSWLQPFLTSSLLRQHLHQIFLCQGHENPGSAAVLKISHFFPAVARSLGGHTNGCGIDCIWQDRQKTGKGLYRNGIDALIKTSFLRRQFTEVLQHRSSNWASLQNSERFSLIHPWFCLLFQECVNMWFYLLVSEKQCSFLRV